MIMLSCTYLLCCTYAFVVLHYAVMHYAYQLCIKL